MQKSQPPVPKDEPKKASGNKHKVVLDTNILVSAFLAPGGTPAKILSLVLSSTILTCCNQTILGEYEEVLSRSKFKSKIAQELIHSVLDFLKVAGLSCSVPASIFPMKDESDRVFYDVAKAAGAFLVTGNKKHYPDEPFIVTPRSFMDPFVNHRN